MKKIFVMALLLILFAATVFLFTKSLSKKEIEPQTKTFGRVEVIVSPKQVLASKPVIFELSLNNHAINLDYNFRDIVKLTDDDGNIYKVASWTGGSGGHHVSGAISFEPLKRGVKSVALNIKGIDGDSGSFIWKI